MPKNVEENNPTSDDRKYLERLDVLLEGTGVTRNSPEARLDPHYVCYKEDSPGGNFPAGEWLMRCSSRWLARENARNFTRLGYTVAVVREADYERWKDKIQG